MSLLLPASAAMSFDFKDPKEISAVSLQIDSPLEPIVGYAKGISGSLAFDPAHPERAAGTISVDASSVRFANDGYTATAQGYALNAKRWPRLTLALRHVERVRRISTTRYEGVVIADFTCRGITRPKRLVVVADYFPRRAEERTNGRFKGDLLVLRTHFAVSRKEHGISEGIPDSMVGDEVQVGVAVVGTHYVAPEPDARWEVELADRDDPSRLRIERTGDRLGIQMAHAAIGGRMTGEKTFRLDPNPQFGPVEGEIDAEGRGFLRLKDGEVPLKGGRVEAFSPATAPASVTTGTGLPALDLPARITRFGTPGVAMAHISNDRVIDVGLYGVRRAGETAIIANSTLFQAGTMGVPVLHLTLLRLAASGRIDLTRPANDYLGEEAIPPGPRGWGARITVRDLMRGTSGIAFAKSGGFAPSEAVPPLSASLGKVSIEREPGIVETISATNEALLERIVAHVTSRPPEEIVKEEVFTRLGMSDSTYASHPSMAAAGHYSSGEPTLDPFHRYPDALGNGLWTSERDFARLLVELGKLLGGRPNVLLSERDRPLLAQVDAVKSVLGIRKSEGGGMYLGGDPYGFYCEFTLNPRRGEAVLVLQNRMMAWRLTNDVVSALQSGATIAPTRSEPDSIRLPRLGEQGSVTLREIRGKKSLVVLFLNEQCGVTVYYKARLQSLERDFSTKGFAFVAVRTGRQEFPGRPAVLPERAYLQMPFLDDAEGALMRAYGIEQSLTFAVIDHAGKLRYLGGLDDRVDASKVTRTPLRDALRALASGHAVLVSRAPAIGCAILPVER